MKINCLLFRVGLPGATILVAATTGPFLVFKCTECGKPIYPDDRIEWDHIHATVHEGPNEHENLRPIHYACHKIKTARDIKANAKVKRLQKPHKSARPMQSGPSIWPKRKFQKRMKK